MANPTLRQRQLAKRLRELRLTAGLSIADVANELLCSQAKISRIETAGRRVSQRDVRDLCALYGVQDNADLMELARDAQKQAWWQESDDADFRQLLGLEDEAIKITEFETTTVPGLLQTEDYARAVIKGNLPQIDPDILDDRIQLRMKRQEILTKNDPPLYSVILDESVIQRLFGGRAVMAAQLSRLLELSERPNITLLVIPYTAGAHMGLDSAFMLLEFDESAGVSDTVYMDHLAGQIFQEKPQQLRRYREVLDQLRSLAQSPRDSAKHIKQRLENLANP